MKMVNPEWWGGKIIPPVPRSKTEEPNEMRVNPYYGGTLGAPVAENNPSESALDPLAAEVTRAAEAFAVALGGRDCQDPWKSTVIDGFTQGYILANRFPWIGVGRGEIQLVLRRFQMALNEETFPDGRDPKNLSHANYFLGLRGGFLFRALGEEYLEEFYTQLDQSEKFSTPEPGPESTEEINSNEWQSEKLDEAYRLIDHARELLTGVKFLAEVLEVDQAVIVLLCKAQQVFLRASGLIMDADTELGNKLS